MVVIHTEKKNLMQLARGKFFIALALLVGSCFRVYSHTPPPIAATQDNKTEETQELELNLLQNILDVLDVHYVKPVSKKELYWRQAAGAASLDKHSSLLTPKEYKELQAYTEGSSSFFGIGIEMEPNNDFIRVISPIDDSPAQKSGIEAGDIILRIDGQSTANMTFHEAAMKIRGAKGSAVKLQILKKDMALKEVTIVRDKLTIKPVTHKLDSDGVAYVRIAAFNEQTTPQLKEAMRKIKQQISKYDEKDKFKGLIIDLRNNAGGLLDSSVDVADMFLDGGDIVSVKSERKDANITRYNANKGDVINGAPIVVLVNSGSASAAEIVAGALQDRKRGVVLGERSFGKGSVQTVVPLPNGGAIKFTIYYFFTPSGRKIDVAGINPDIVVPIAKVNYFNIEGLTMRQEDFSKLPEEVKKMAKDAEKPDQDFQLSTAKNIIKALKIGSQCGK